MWAAIPLSALPSPLRRSGGGCGPSATEPAGLRSWLCGAEFVLHDLVVQAPPQPARLPCPLARPPSPLPTVALAPLCPPHHAPCRLPPCTSPSLTSPSPARRRLAHRHPARRRHARRRRLHSHCLPHRLPPQPPCTSQKPLYRIEIKTLRCGHIWLGEINSTAHSSVGGVSLAVDVATMAFTWRALRPSGRTHTRTRHTRTPHFPPPSPP